MNTSKRSDSGSNVVSSSDLIDAKLEEHQVCVPKLCPGCGHKLEGKPVSVREIYYRYYTFSETILGYSSTRPPLMFSSIAECFDFHQKMNFYSAYTYMSFFF